MSSDLAIRVEQLGKRYYTPQRSAAREGIVKRHLKSLGLWRRSEEDYFWALRDLCFEVKQGEILGILGQNGSGKSTLLKILSGVTPPTTGRAEIHGRIGSLLEVGTGFHPDMSGRENVYMNGALLGIPKDEIRARFDEIVNFSGIEEFIDVPVKRYSSGMYVRLAYAVASMLRSDILILDEVLAVGDVAFQEKARENMRQAVNAGRTILFVSHNWHQITNICTQAIALNHGRIIAQGGVREVTMHLLRNVFRIDKNKDNCFCTSADLRTVSREFGCNAGVLTKIKVFDGNMKPTTFFKTGKPFVVQLYYSNAHCNMPYFMLTIVNQYGNYMTTLFSTHNSLDLIYPSNGVIECRVESLQIPEGDYVITACYGCWSGYEGSHRHLDYIPNALKIKIDTDGYVRYPATRDIDGTVHKSTWAIK
ncbi:MAG: ABC transporter ATP-binding protein [Desulfovibrionaceae bacterium]|nr:ABC transporter ATP-binding protein [Desulfovibrionaceae bacterium]